MVIRDVNSDGSIYNERLRYNFDACSLMFTTNLFVFSSFILNFSNLRNSFAAFLFNYLIENPVLYSISGLVFV